MTAVFGGLVILDGWLDGSFAGSPAGGSRVKATILMILVALILGLGGMEFSWLAGARGLVVLNPVSTVGLVLLATAWYWPQVFGIPLGLYVLLVTAFVLAGVMLQQHARFGTTGVLANCGISCFSLLYLGVLGAFILGIRLDVGLWQVLMFIFVVKCSDIGAYAFGRLFGKHKLAPQVSPGKTWEGLAGAIVVGMVVSFAFAVISGIMGGWLALVFGGCMGAIGQLSDLSESLLKRDAQRKDSSNRIPGFGGILDVVDSPLFAAPLAYIFLRLVG